MDEMTVEMVISICDDEFYRKKRYSIPLSMMLIDCDNKESFKILEKNIRQIDIMQKITKDRLLICLTHTDEKSASLFIEKIKAVITCKDNMKYIIKEYDGEDKIKFVNKLFEDYSKL